MKKKNDNKKKIEKKESAPKEKALKEKTLRETEEKVLEEKEEKVVKREKKDSNKNKNFSFDVVEVVFMVVISIFFGIVVGFVLTYRRNPISGEKVSSELQEFISVYDNIRENYYNDVDDKKLLDAAISGMVGTLNDPNSIFMDDETASAFTESVRGYYIGIGAAVQTVDGQNRVIEVYKNSAAEKVGLKEDDVIVKVDGKDVSNLDSSELSKLIRGEVNTSVKITVLRDNKEKTFKIKRKKIEIENADSRIIEKDGKKIGYLFIESFSSNSYKQTKKALEELEDKGFDGLIIDLRDNPGGYLTQAQKILDLFFDKKTVLYRLETKGETKKYYASTSEKRDYPVVLIGSNSTASAAEVMISCFKENYDDATFVGEITYGKGTVQKSINLSTGAAVKYTTQKWYTSKGKWLDGGGIEPDVHILLNNEYYEYPCDETDKQLQAALDVLTKEKD